MGGVNQLKVEVDAGSTDEKIEVYNVADMPLASALLLQSGIELKNILENNFQKKGVTRRQCIFVIENVSSGKPLKEWVLDYHNDKLMVPPNKYIKKINDLRDLINQKFVD